MKTKHIISLTIAFCFIVMSITGLFMYFGQKEWHAIETLHILFGVIFLGFAIFHILNNWSSITGYSKNKRENKWQKELIVAASIFGVFLIGGALEVPPFMQMAHGGKQLFGPKRERGEMVAFQEIKTNQTQTGKNLDIILQKSKEVKLPTMAIWVEDSAHNFIENLFVPAQTVRVEEGANEPIGKMIAEGEVEFLPLDPQTLPTFNQKGKTKVANFDRFTPLENVIIHSKTTLKGKGFVLLEIKDANKTELYQGSIDTVNGGISVLKTAKGDLLERSIIELK